VVYNNGSIVHYPNGATVNDPSAGGTTFTCVNWNATKDGTMELRSQDTVIANVKLSTRSSSTIADWLQGNIWNSSNDDERSPNSTNAKAIASRTDATGAVIKVDTASA